jgi:HSP20 family protein
MAWKNDDTFDKIVEKIFKQFAFKEFPITDDPNIRTWSYGFTVTQGPDGIPIIKEYGQNPFQQPETFTIEGRLEDEILTQVDVDQENKKVRIIADLPGVTKEAIKITTTDNKVNITAHNETQKYKGDVPLSVKVDPKTADAKYNNGILDITLNILNEGVEVQVN